MSSSCDACGWLAAACSMLSFGSFGVPIKSKTALEVDIDPLVMQSYKTFICFVTSWLVLAVPGQEFSFSPWGIVSGLFWVPGGIATVYAIKSAGIAIGIGIGSSFIVLVSFVWGIFIFQERVHSKGGASLAILCMMLGLAGMSYFSSPEIAGETSSHTAEVIEAHHPTSSSLDPQLTRSSPGLTTDASRRRIGNNQISPNYQKVQPRESNDKMMLDKNHQVAASGRFLATDSLKLSTRTTQSLTSYSSQSGVLSEGEGLEDDPYDDGIMVDLPSLDDDDVDDDDDDLAALETRESLRRSNSCLNQRQRGMLAAAFCGIYGGSIMAPMKYAPEQAKGIHYLLSFSIGATLVTLTLWLLRFVYYCVLHRSILTAYFKLPSFYLRVMWLPGCLCGLLWSIGNFFSLISVYYLGEGVGYPLVQTSILVSGLWGIFYFQEVTGTERIAKWLASSLLTILGILLLSYEHYKQ